MRLLTAREAAATLRVSMSYLEKDRASMQEIPFIRIGRKVRYDADSLERLVAANSRGGA